MNLNSKNREDICKILGTEYYAWMPELAFKTDDPLQIGKILYLIGKKGTGKTTALYNLLYRLRHIFWGGYAFVGSQTTVEQLSNVLPVKVITDEFSKYKLEDIYIKVQRMIKKYGKKRYNLQKHHFLIILDDVCWDRKILNLPVLRKFHMNCRHIGATIIICAQYVMDLAPDKRAQIDYAFMLKNTIPKEIEKIRENYVPIMEKERKVEFAKVFSTLNQPGRIMVIDTTASNKSQDVQKTIGFFNTFPIEDVPPFTFGSDEFWACCITIPKRFLLQHYKEQHDREREKEREKEQDNNSKSRDQLPLHQNQNQSRNPYPPPQNQQRSLSHQMYQQSLASRQMNLPPLPPSRSVNQNNHPTKMLSQQNMMSFVLPPRF